MKQTIQTGLNRERSKVVIQKAMEAYSARFPEYSPRFEWVGDGRAEFGFKAKGVALNGTMVVLDQKVDVDMDVPFLFRVFQGKAMAVIEDQVKVWIEKENKGEIV